MEAGVMLCVSAISVQHRVRHHLSLRQWSVGCWRQGHSVHMSAQIALIDTGMHLDLIGRQRGLQDRRRLLQHRHREIRHAAMAYLALGDKRVEDGQGLAQWHLTRGPVQQQVDVVSPKRLQTRLYRFAEIPGSEVVRQDLGCQEDPIARGRGSTQAFTDLGLIFVGLRGVDMAVAFGESRLGDLARFARIHLEGAKAKRWN